MPDKIDITLNALLVSVENEMRHLLVSRPQETKLILEKLGSFAENVKQLVRQLSSEEEDRLHLRVPEATTGLSRYNLSDDFTNALDNVFGSQQADSPFFIENRTIAPVLLVRREHYLVNDASETTDGQNRWPENDNFDTISTYQGLSLSASGSPPRTDSSELANQVTVNPAMLCGRASTDLCSPESAVQEHVSNESCHIFRDTVANTKRLKKRASNVQIQPVAKRSKRSSASISKAASVIDTSIKKGQRTRSTRRNVDFPIDQSILPTRNSPFRYSEVEGVFKDRLGHQELKYAPHLTTLFFATASPSSFRQLAEAMRALKSREIWKASESSQTIADLVRGLDVLENSLVANSLLRRFFLLRLFSEWARLKERIQAERPSLRSGQRTEGEGGKVASLVLTKMLREAYPSLAASPTGPTELEKKRKSLKNKLQMAKHWNTLREAFSVGIVALVPMGTEFQIQNQSFEYLRSRPFTIFIEVLKDLRAEFVSKAAELLSPHAEAILEGRERPFALKIEQLDDLDAVTEEPPDSQALLDLCQPSIDS